MGRSLYGPQVQSRFFGGTGSLIWKLVTRKKKACLYGLCYEVKAAPPGTDVKCEDVCPDTGRCVGNVCDVKPAVEGAGQSADAVSGEADASLAAESGSPKGVILGIVGVFLGGLAVLTA